jgi:hypothetical protein
MSISALLSRASRKPVHGQVLRPRVNLVFQRIWRRDPSVAKSDVVWALVEKMLHGDSNAAVILSDLIGNGITTGSTRFERITRKAWTRFGRTTPAAVQPGAFAAVTPGRSVVLFGIKKEYKTSDPPAGAMRGYLRRFKVGDTAEYNSYNLVYLGKITKITAKQITIVHYPSQAQSRKSVFDVETFNSKNYDLDVEKAVKRNQEWSD